MSDMMKEKIACMPKPVFLVLSVLGIALLGYGFYVLAFGGGRGKEQVDTATITLDMPDAAGMPDRKSIADSYREGEYARENVVDDYWNSLGDGLLSLGGASAPAGADSGSADLSGYTDEEVMLIRNGVKTREEIDAEHRRMREFEESVKPSSSEGRAYRRLTQQQEDSIYYERMERAYEMAMRYQNAASGTAPVQEDVSSEAESVEEERRIEIERTIPVTSISEDNIISSLDTAEPSSFGVDNSVYRKPVKATFLKNEKVGEGQRVIIRLMQDLTLSDGTVIPANTHITGQCSFGRRLKIRVSMLHYGGRMFPTDLSVYDNDGTEGIYCPMVEEKSRKSRQAKNMAAQVVGAAGSVAGTVVSGNPFLGSVASSGISNITSSINSDGSMSVNVMAGYEFFLYENLKESQN